jgi:hypothetical protein
MFNEVSQHAPICSLAVIARPTPNTGNVKRGQNGSSVPK